MRSRMSDLITFSRNRCSREDAGAGNLCWQAAEYATDRRACMEERLLSDDPMYRKYASRREIIKWIITVIATSALASGKPVRYAAVGAPNQVVSASASPSWV